MNRFSGIVTLAATFGVVLALVASIGFTPELKATKEIYQEAREKYGKDVKGCKHCHVGALPKEEDHAFNERGQWLVDQKAERKADKVDVAWLDEYKGN